MHNNAIYFLAFLKERKNYNGDYKRIELGKAREQVANLFKCVFFL